MVKGISRQVVVVQSPDQKLFDQAIFILKDNAAVSGGITEEALLREANIALRQQSVKGSSAMVGVVGAVLGAAAVGILWLLTVLA